MMDILTDYPLETKVIRKHALMIAWRLAVRFFIKAYRDSLVGPKDPIKKELEKRRITVANVNFESSDAEKDISAYFRDRDLRRAEREFGQTQLHSTRDGG